MQPKMLAAQSLLDAHITIEGLALSDIASERLKNKQERDSALKKRQLRSVEGLPAIVDAVARFTRT